LQSTENQLVTKWQNKRCLIGLQKGVSKGLKGHLLQAKRAFFRSQKSMYSKLWYEKLWQSNRLL